jgi:hypothetical protein
MLVYKSFYCYGWKCFPNTQCNLTWFISRNSTAKEKKIRTQCLRHRASFMIIICAGMIYALLSTFWQSVECCVPQRWLTHFSSLTMEGLFHAGTSNILPAPCDMLLTFSTWPAHVPIYTCLFMELRKVVWVAWNVFLCPLQTQIFILANPRTFKLPGKESYKEGLKQMIT